MLLDHDLALGVPRVRQDHQRVQRGLHQQQRALSAQHDAQEVQRRVHARRGQGALPPAGAQRRQRREAQRPQRQVVGRDPVRAEHVCPEEPLGPHRCALRLLAREEKRHKHRSQEARTQVGCRQRPRAPELVHQQEPQRRLRHAEQRVQLVRRVHRPQKINAIFLFLFFSGPFIRAFVERRPIHMARWNAKLLLTKSLACRWALVKQKA